MRLPAPLDADLARLTAAVADRDITRQDAVTRLRDAISAHADGELRLGIFAEFAARTLEAALRARRASRGTTPDGQSDLFPELPRRLYIRPGQLKSVILFTRHDWHTARAVLENRTSNAKKAAESDWAAFIAAYQQVVPLLTDDDLTTADVAPQIDAAPAVPPARFATP